HARPSSERAGRSRAWAGGVVVVDSGVRRPYGVRVIDARNPVLTVLCGEQRPPAMAGVEDCAEVRYTDEAGLPEALRGADVAYAYEFRSTALPKIGRASCRGGGGMHERDGHVRGRD